MTDNPADSTISPLRKKLLFRAWHRGTREADLLMGRFAEDFLPKATTEQTAQFERLLAEEDPDIFDWVTGKTQLPDAAFAPLLRHFMDFYKTAA